MAVARSMPWPCQKCWRTIICQRYSIRVGSSPMTSSARSSMAPTMPRVCHSSVASPQPQSPGWSVTIFTNTQFRILAWQTWVSTRQIFMLMSLFQENRHVTSYLVISTAAAAPHSTFTGLDGLAHADVTPPAGIFCRNWGAVHDTAEGIHRPLFLAAPAIRGGNRRGVYYRHRPRSFGAAAAEAADPRGPWRRGDVSPQDLGLADRRRGRSWHDGRGLFVDPAERSRRVSRPRRRVAQPRQWLNRLPATGPLYDVEIYQAWQTPFGRGSLETLEAAAISLGHELLAS